MARNTAPVITGNHLKRLTEDGNTTTTGGDLDVKYGPDVFLAFEIIEGTYGTFSINEAGVWTYTLDNSREVTQALTRGETAYDWFYAQAANGSTGQGVVVKITGAADAAPAPTAEIELVGVPDLIA